MKGEMMVACFCVWFAALFCAAAPSASSDAAANVIHVGSYNIRYVAGDRGTENDWDKRRDDLVSQIRGFNLDAFGLQEVDPEQMQYLQEKMSGYGFVGEHRNPDRKSGEASPVAYRKDRFDLEKHSTFWLSETPEVPGSVSKSWRAACRRVCTYAVLKDRATGTRLCFVNTHLDGARALATENGMRLILERMKDFAADVPVVFTGDHNCVETSKAAKMATEVLKDALYASERPPEGLWRTGGGFSGKEREISIAEALKRTEAERNSKDWRKNFGGRIDYIYVSPCIRVLSYKTDASVRPGLNLYPSDHLPLVATILLP